MTALIPTIVFGVLPSLKREQFCQGTCHAAVTLTGFEFLYRVRHRSFGGLSHAAEHKKHKDG
jgi:hypothetical protein